MTKIPSVDESILRLHDMLSRRPQPELVALELVDSLWFYDLPTGIQRKIRILAAHARRMRRVGMPMDDTFQKHEGLAKPFLDARYLLNGIVESTENKDKTLPVDPDASQPEPLLAWVVDAMELLELPSADLRTRMNSHELAEKLPGVSSRSYLKACRAVLHVRERAMVLLHRRALERAIGFGKTRLASTITLGELKDAPMTASFVAYYTARLGRRTLFAVDSQSRPADEIAEALLECALAEGRYAVLARVLTRRSILDKLSAPEAHQLLAEYTKVLHDNASQLERLFDTRRRRSPMVVRKGDDSSAWNACALAFNQARTGILNLSGIVPGLREGLDAALPGKVPSLVAADLMRWYDDSSTPLQDDSSVFAALPLPWDVLFHGETCTRQMVEEACAANNIKASETGWTEPYRQSETETSAPTPVSLHGVVIPYEFAALRSEMRRAGWFAGKS